MRAEQERLETETVVSRGVRCGIVSTPVNRSIATDAISPLIRARARGLSFTSTKSALPDSRTARAVAISASGFAPSGGSICTETTNSPSRSIRSSRVSALVGAAGARLLALADEQRAGGRAALVHRARGSRRSAPASCRSSRRSAERRARAPARRTRRNTPASRAGRRSACRTCSQGRRSGTPRAARRRGRASARSSAARRPARRRGWRRTRRAPARRSRSAACSAETPASVSPSASKVISATIGRLETERTAATAVSSSARSKNVSTMNRSTPRPSSSRACSAKSTAGSWPRQLDVAERPDRAADEHLATRDLACLARQLHRRPRPSSRTRPRGSSAQFRAGGAEAVRLDQVGARADVAEMDVDHRLRRADVRLLGTAQPAHRACEQDARAAVGHDRRPGREALEEAAHCRPVYGALKETPVAADDLARASAAGLTALSSAAGARAAPQRCRPVGPPWGAASRAATSGSSGPPCRRRP